MKDTELRIGNYVWLKSKNKIYQISSGHDIDEGINSDDFDPLPLTEDILLRFGFSPINYQDEVIYLKEGFACNIEIRKAPINDSMFLVFTVQKDIKYLNKIPLFGIKSVHQLQNLFFALTGEELILQ